VTPAQEWTSVHSPHFVVSTDDGEKRYRELAPCFEAMRRVFERLVSNDKLSSPVPLQILAFRNSKGFSQVAPFITESPIRELWACFERVPIWIFRPNPASRSFFHEYAPFVLHSKDH